MSMQDKKAELKADWRAMAQSADCWEDTKETNPEELNCSFNFFIFCFKLVFGHSFRLEELFEILFETET